MHKHTQILARRSGSCQHQKVLRVQEVVGYAFGMFSVRIGVIAAASGLPSYFKSAANPFPSPEDPCFFFGGVAGDGEVGGVSCRASSAPARSAPAACICCPNSAAPSGRPVLEGRGRGSATSPRREPGTGSRTPTKPRSSLCREPPPRSSRIAS